MGFERPLPKGQAAEGGWMTEGMVRRRHLCFPPHTFPQGVATGSKWRCSYRIETGEFSQGKPCGTVWVSYGTVVHHDAEDWPTATPSRAILGPECWRIEGWPRGLELQEYEAQDGSLRRHVPALESGAKKYDTIVLEHDLYDFRGLAALGIKYERMKAQAAGLKWKAIYD